MSRYLGTNRRPRLELHGVWHNPDWVMNDHGTLSHDFEPDGTLYTGNSPSRPTMREVVPVTLRAGGRGAFDTACAAAKVR